MKILHNIWASLTMFWCMTFHDVTVSEDETYVQCDCGRHWSADQ